MCTCVYICTINAVLTEARRGRQVFREMEAQRVVSHLILVMRIELESSGRAAVLLAAEPSLQPPLHLYFKYMLWEMEGFLREVPGVRLCFRDLTEVTKVSLFLWASILRAENFSGWSQRNAAGGGKEIWGWQGSLDTWDDDKEGEGSRDIRTSPTADSQEGRGDRSPTRTRKRIWWVPKPINSETESVPELLGPLPSTQSCGRLCYLRVCVCVAKFG